MSSLKGRPSWDQYFLEVAFKVAERSTCLRRLVGAIAVKDKRILSSGYNGPPTGVKHCEDRGGCIRQIRNIPSGQSQEICYAIHAEENVIIQIAIHGGSSLRGSDLFCTTQPCVMCVRKIINCGFKRLLYVNAYNDELTKDILDEVATLQIKNIGGEYKNVHIWTFNCKHEEYDLEA